jgi:hypothetical protein
MTYENAPATKMLATDCACCARPLVDSKSVEIGMGPTCRKKHGLEIACSDEVRAQANKIVHKIACDRSTGINLSTLQAVAEVRALGFNKLADVLTDRLADVKITVEGATLYVAAPYSEAATEAFRKVPGRRWDKDRKVNTCPLASKGALFAMLQACYAGKLGIGPKGPFTL